jgi:hypothetical protein
MPSLKGEWVVNLKYAFAYMPKSETNTTDSRAQDIRTRFSWWVITLLLYDVVD